MKNNPTLTTEIGRYFLTDRIREEVDFRGTEQSRGTLPPPVQKAAPPDSSVIPLPKQEEWDIPPCELKTAIGNRESRRSFTSAPLSLQEVAFLLWATQGVRAKVHEAAVLRTVPSAGCRHPLETYLAVMRVEGLESGIYRYLPLEHALVRVRIVENLPASVAAACHGQRFAGQAAVTFMWTAIPHRTEWRYGEASYKVIAIDAGHVCQNLYLACEAIGSGTCAIAAYNQTLVDELLGVDGDEEFAVYLAPVGKVASK
ncbi:SagB/ThcOx family dehydrogenase [Geomonas sp. RF6]|uniref:SagB/ThcOx family dehydrogenase n=1 Tax=Geomonas sp. RF6 TaxID=2897342 RepID=UPI001E38D26B|nr:SagB/ThcOx family dehydrogenase [Geomonas sp. RF6]UFS69006.1 SagB/ThcOx family dehydrogenase [Geomonas sp. RF6]